ncbi:putative porin [Pseudoalteromonas sp. MMG010]|uniref:putative porin n=1 Tax=Pseudoalteromonas sp. MMG010 TaxID=2822685 RepID=UPI001B3A78AD|nr:putative porin [Pseudoalteromonas sp. MMG010]MBQ4832106.1 putative porin [Pseudoalteromonas sp. MMG010]
MRSILLLLLLCCSTNVLANVDNSEPKRWFNTLQYSKITPDSINAYQATSSYFFADQQHSGVWDDYGYLDTDSNVSISYQNIDSESVTGFYGEGFINNWFVLAEVSDTDNFNNNTLGFGYVYNDNLKAAVRLESVENDNNTLWFSSYYNTQINDTDYFGAGFEIDEHVDNWQVSSRYFSHLGNSRYFTLDTAYENGEDNVFSALANYYFNTQFALGAGIQDSHLQLEAKYFINSRFFFTANFTDYDEGDETSIQFSAFF